MACENTSESAAASLGRDLAQLLQHGLAPSTHKNYARSWQKLKDFMKTELQEPISLPLSSHTIALFITHLHNQGYAPSTIATHLAALGHVHKLNDWQDPTNNFLIRKLQASLKRLATHSLAQLPITLEMLEDLLEQLPRLSYNRYSNALYKALFLTQYHACARIGELTISGGNTTNVIQLNQLSYSGDLATVTNLTIDFTHFKHSKEIRSAPITVYKKDGRHCPVTALQHYLALRGNQEGPLFLGQNRMPVTRTQASGCLRCLLVAGGYDCSRYDTHSMRIGRTSQAAVDGWSETQIQCLGRWQSNAYKKYVRLARPRRRQGYSEQGN